MRIILYPYKMYSSSAKKLANALNSQRIFPHGRYRALWNDMVVNWGNSTIPTWYGRILNSPDKVANATNKLKTFRLLQEHSVRTPTFTEHRTDAQSWIREGATVYCRTKLGGHSGSGIIIANSEGTDVVDAPLYTYRVKAKKEYRVHVFKGRLLDFQQKKRRNGVETNNLIRNHRNGYVFTREGVILPTDVGVQAINAVNALGLDFGAVDIGYVEREDKAYVYEVNTAPGLENSTIELYSNAIMEIAQHV
jgi:hypothetical protein